MISTTLDPRKEEPTVLDYARRYTTDYGWRVVPVPFKRKAPRLPNWNALALTADELPRYFNGAPQNIGVLLGDPSRNLIDVDLDCLEALQLAPFLLPPTCSFGRKSKRLSHYLYYVDKAPKTERFQLGGRDSSGAVTSETLVEIRSTGSQTLFPPSMHPSGESIRFENERAVARIEAALLRDKVRLLAIASVLLRAWPRQAGSRHAIALAVAGVLLGSGEAEEEVARLMGAVAQLAGDEEVADRLRTVHDTAVGLGNGHSVTGWQALSEHVNEGAIAALRKWLRAPDTRVLAQMCIYKKGQGLQFENEAPLGLEIEEVLPLPEKTVELLPDMLRGTCAAFSREHERTTFLVGVLPLLASCMPNVCGYYGEIAYELEAPYYVAIVAEAASGKSVLREAEQLVREVDTHIREQSEHAHRQWLREKEEAEQAKIPFHDPEPPTRSLILPANASAASFHLALNHRGGRAACVETEIDTLLNALKQDWGKFDDTLRKAYHHERVSYLRKSEEVYIERPVLGLVLSGTEAQFQRLMGSTENGLYSRFSLYYFMRAPQWRDQRPAKGAADRRRFFQQVAGNVLGMYRILASRQTPLRFEMTPEQWDRHSETFDASTRKTNALGASHLTDVVFRSGVTAFRIAMILCVIRAWENKEPLTDERPTLIASTEDVEAALLLARMHMDHALRFAYTLPKQSARSKKDQRIATILGQLPGIFTNAEVYEAAQQCGYDVSERTVQRDLKRMARRGLIEENKRGHWRKSL